MILDQQHYVTYWYRRKWDQSSSTRELLKCILNERYFSVSLGIGTSVPDVFVCLLVGNYWGVSTQMPVNVDRLLSKHIHHISESVSWHKW